jgi:hypothetical protein
MLPVWLFLFLSPAVPLALCLFLLLLSAFFFYSGLVPCCSGLFRGFFRVFFPFLPCLLPIKIFFGGGGFFFFLPASCPLKCFWGFFFSLSLHATHLDFSFAHLLSVHFFYSSGLVSCCCGLVCCGLFLGFSFPYCLLPIKRFFLGFFFSFQPAAR